MHDYSSWKEPAFVTANPSSPLKSISTENPDIVAPVTTTADVSMKQTHLWTSNSGTSFAAPAITGILALREEYCSRRFGERGKSYTIRSALRNLAYSDGFLEPSASCLSNQQASFPHYPTPNPLCDYRTGVGKIDADRIKLTCPNAQYVGGDFGFSADLPATQIVEGSANPSSVSVPAWIERRFLKERGQVFVRFVVIEDDLATLQGTRHRASLSYMSCPTGRTDIVRQKLTNVDDIGVAVDFDLALCGQARSGGSKCVAVSDSFDDTDEGFDVFLEEDFEWMGYAIVAPEEWKPCGDDSEEPFALTYSYWYPGVWER